MTQRGYQVIIILPIKSKMAAAKKRCFLRFLYFTESSPPSFKVRGLQMTMNLAFSRRHSKLNLLTILLFIDCSKMARIIINTRIHTKEKPYLINSYQFFQIGKAKKSIG